MSDGSDGDEAAPERGFVVRLDAFEGPFDLLLHLIASRRLDVTEVALGQVTEDFLRHVARAGDDLDLEEATAFLVVAATLLDWKAARLLPSAEVEDPDDLDRLTGPDLLFARLLAYRAFVSAAQLFAALMGSAGRVHLRSAPLEPHLAALLPEVVLPPPERFARLAAAALAPRPVPQVALEHLHAPAVDVVAETARLLEVLAAAPDGRRDFADLVADAEAPQVVGRFLALLLLHRDGRVRLVQPQALGALEVRLLGAPTGAGAT